MYNAHTRGIAVSFVSFGKVVQRRLTVKDVWYSIPPTFSFTIFGEVGADIAASERSFRGIEVLNFIQETKRRHQKRNLWTCAHLRQPVDPYFLILFRIPRRKLVLVPSFCIFGPRRHDFTFVQVVRVEPVRKIALFYTSSPQKIRRKP